MDPRNLTAMVRRMLMPLARRISLTVSRGVVKIVNDSLKCQGLQVELVADELQDGVERFQDYGFTSTPLAGAEALFLAVGGMRSHGIVACVTDRRYRPKNLPAGAVCLFTDKGERVYLDPAADIVNLGAKTGAEFVALATKTDARIAALENSVIAMAAGINANVTLANTAVSALITWAMAVLPATPAFAGVPPALVEVPVTPPTPGASVAATKVKAT